MTEGQRIVVAMSGGVDSSVAAALLVDQGYDVVGVMMRLWAEKENRCCTPAAVDDARWVAAQLGIPFYVVNYEREFQDCVVDYFLHEYSRGRTPNPCLACNQHIRFGRLLRHALALDADRLATGHYARVEQLGGRYQLHMARDRAKDQSYVLYMLGQDELQRVRFPLGDLTKEDVRALARARGLSVAGKEESMDLCFVTGGDYRRFLGQHAPEAVEPGPILNRAGQELGQHQGLPFYTIGQRRGLGIAAPEALYVTRLDTARNALFVGPAHELGRSALMAGQVSYVSGQAPDRPVPVQVKIRYRARLAEATWIPLAPDQARVELASPLRDITPGQAVVAYEQDRVLGGGIIRGNAA